MAAKWSLTESPQRLWIACEDSITGQYLSGRKKVEVPENAAKGNGKKLRIIGAAQNNLKNVNGGYSAWENLSVLPGCPVQENPL